MDLIALHEPDTDVFAPPPLEVDGSLRQQVWGVLATLYPLDTLERRQNDRFAYPRLLKLTPVDAAGKPIADTFIVAGKHLSERGLGFYHPGPLPYKLVHVALQRDRTNYTEMLLNLTWCKFVSHGWYESGGWFVRGASTLARSGS